nr:amidohydrolase family protein [Egibacter rhizosphaerae]
MRTLISGGTVVTSTWSGEADVLVDGERIAAVGRDLPADGVERTIDAGGRYVIPGGIDVHTHMQMPFGGTFSADDFESGTAAAAWGGTTTIVDFAIQPRGGALREGLEEWHRKADGVCSIDYGFHMIMSDVNEQSLKEMDAVVDEGVTSFKLFMAYPGVFYSDDGQILRALKRAGDNGSQIMLHAENGIAIDVLVAESLAAGRTQPIEHGLTRPASMEGEAVHRAVELARLAGTPLYIVHLSAEDALREVQDARDAGQSVYAGNLSAIPVSYPRRVARVDR